MLLTSYIADYGAPRHVTSRMMSIKKKSCSNIILWQMIVCMWALPPDDTLWQTGQSSCQFVSNVLGEVLDSSAKRHHHKAMLCRVVHQGLKILRGQRQNSHNKLQIQNSMLIYNPNFVSSSLHNHPKNRSCNNVTIYHLRFDWLDTIDDIKEKCFKLPQGKFPYRDNNKVIVKIRKGFISQLCFSRFTNWEKLFYQ